MSLLHILELEAGGIELAMAQVCCNMQVKIMDEEKTEVVLRTDGSGEGMEGDEGMDVLPPLAPGQKPRAQG